MLLGITLILHLESAIRGLETKILEHWVIPEKIHTPPTDGTLEILAGGGVEGSGNPGRRGGFGPKILLRGAFSL